MNRLKYITALLLLTICFISCKENQGKSNSNEKKTTSKDFQVESKEDVLITKGYTESAQTDFTVLKYEINEWSENTIVKKSRVYRYAKEENSQDWTNIKVETLYDLKNKIKVGSFVQVFPLSSELPSLVLKVNDNEFDKENKSYNAELEEIKNSNYWTFIGPKKWTQNSPVELIAIYPPVENIKVLYEKNFKKETLPTNVFNDIIRIAFDLNSNGLPDVILCEFDCKNRNPEPEDYTCSETYLKINNKWEMIESSTPQ